MSGSLFMYAPYTLSWVLFLLFVLSYSNGLGFFLSYYILLFIYCHLGASVFPNERYKWVNREERGGGEEVITTELY